MYGSGLMATSELRIGAVGCGARGRRILERLQALGRTRITALYDPAAGTAERVRAELAPEAYVAAGYREVVRREDVDLVLVCSPDHAHREPAVAAFQHGKHVFCEKPMATTVADCQAIWDAARAAERHLIVGFVLRYAPFYRELKRRLERGDLGRLVSIEANENLGAAQGAFFHRDWRRFRKFTGSYLLEKCCHDLDILTWFAGALPRRVASFGGRSVFTPRPEAPRYCRDCDLECAHRLRLEDPPPKPTTRAELELSRGRALDLCCFNSEQDIVDHQVAIIEYENGVRATFHANQNCGMPSRRMYVVGDAGCIEGDLYWGYFQFAPVTYTRDFEGSEWQRTEVGNASQHGGGDERQLASCVAALLEGGPPPAGGRDGLVASVTALAIDEARLGGGVVDLSERWRRLGVAS
jgi:predicted dehydrogenase